ncbi:MAG: DUF3793 family protein [Catenisphaera adipataccumulans]|jgi:hypothetical protein|uniref:DUF3793 family protein n=1 Tax=Catenisphaera adipataccumulans TaxID=700500 RepID=UPI003D93F72C
MPINGLLFQEHLIQYSACTLGHMKTGSLFRILKSELPNYEECMRYFCDLCTPFGYRIMILKETNAFCLIYVYDRMKLEHMLSNAAIQNFLSTFGYEDFTVPGALHHLKRSMQEEEFPHEVGIFLGYPLQDVRAFLSPERNQKYLLVGYWKVYSRLRSNQKKFYRYDCLNRTMQRKAADGASMESILESMNPR